MAMTLFQKGREAGVCKGVDADVAADAVIAIMIVTLEKYAGSRQGIHKLNDALGMIADAIAGGKRGPFEALG